MNEQRTDSSRWTFTGGSELKVPHVASMTWRDGLFAHWPVDPDELRPHIPGQMHLETRDGHAWVSILPFVLTNVGFRGTPSILRFAFAELAVRTRVRYRGEPGLYFFSIDIGNSLIATTIGQAARFPVSRARTRVSATERNHIRFSSERTGRDGGIPATFAAAYRPDGEPFTAEPNTLAYWLTARRRFYASTDRGVIAVEIAHEPWPLQPATASIEENTLFDSNGLPTPTDDPIFYYADKLSMTVSMPRRPGTPDSSHG
ncbi:YqjF family protein [Natrinema halophilum]|uniref:DUF2071 domain-containing protein n=1 Tax=Natrinema halophilum TaxID=1699371 RepID=A0A7D5KRS1_9EURY|nr:DUF2071 domain-containing protein [Natrinema halophilum]QLG49617.1 DUF2071 domain-containing protein [Natrinema halophilum]